MDLATLSAPRSLVSGELDRGSTGRAGWVSNDEDRGESRGGIVTARIGGVKLNDVGSQPNVLARLVQVVQCRVHDVQQYVRKAGCRH